MKRILMAMVFALAMGQASAEDLKIRDVFKQMPDSLMPYLTQNNRLDFIDFLDSDMKAEVRNRFGGTSEMTSLSDDSLVIRMNESYRVDLLLLPLSEPMDSVSQVVVMIETFLVDSLYGESCVRYYSPDWNPIPQKPPFQEDQLKRIETKIMQNILKKDEDLVNKP